MVVQICFLSESLCHDVVLQMSAKSSQDPVIASVPAAVLVQIAPLCQVGVEERAHRTIRPVPRFTSRIP